MRHRPTFTTGCRRPRKSPVPCPNPTGKGKTLTQLIHEYKRIFADRLQTERDRYRDFKNLADAIRHATGSVGPVPHHQRRAGREVLKKACNRLLRHKNKIQACESFTLDRNAGIEYFDSPRDNREIYDAYVIDCVPEREDLGCLQLITSTSNLQEVRNLLDGSLDQMGLSRSRRNAEFLLEHLKALSGRLAIRLTGQRSPTAELIALAVCHANCRQAANDDACWTSLRCGFFVPVDDIRDLLPPLSANAQKSLTDEGLEEADKEEKATRPDLIHVSLVPRKGLLFRFSEVKYRRHLRTARSPDTLQKVRQQVESLRQRWEEWYAGDGVCASFRAIRRAKLSRVLRFYADKARRHADDDERVGLSAEAHSALVGEIDRLVAKGGDYSFPSIQCPDRGWLFCPEYAGGKPLEVTPSGWETRVFLFGPDSNFRRDAIGHPPTEDTGVTAVPAETCEEEDGSDDRAGSGTGDSVEPVDREGGSAPSVCLGTNLLTGAEVRWPLTVKGNPHLLVAGLPGMGKTTCLLNVCRQMLNAGIRPIVFSYHQDIDEKLQQMVGSVRFIDFHGLGFNPLQVIDRNSRMAYLDVAGALRDIFVAIFPEQPVVLRIHSTQNDNLQKAFASLVFYGLYKDMFRRGTRDRITHAMIFDEAHRAARLQLIPTMAKECRKYGISLVLASQEARDFNISLFSAIANYLILRLTETDAKVLARNVASSDQERTLIDRIKQMGRFRAFYCCEGLKKPVPVGLQP